MVIRVRKAKVLIRLRLFMNKCMGEIELVIIGMEDRKILIIIAHANISYNRKSSSNRSTINYKNSNNNNKDKDKDKDKKIKTNPINPTSC